MTMARVLSPTGRLTAGFDRLPTFLAPSLLRQLPQPAQNASFSTTSTTYQRHQKIPRRRRGVSALRRTGPRMVFSVSKEPLPVPVLDPAKRSKVKVSDNHGLWGFFGKDKKAILPPESEAAHGRAWAVEELRHKSFEDLHCLWWTCMKERNRISTQECERIRLEAGYGEAEAQGRDRTVRGTQRAIKHVLTERWYAYQEAVKLALQDSSAADMFEEDVQVEESLVESPFAEEDQKMAQAEKDSVEQSSPPGDPLRQERSRSASTPA